MKIGRRKGFTLIELLIVVAIIGILVAIIVPNIGSFGEKARIAQAKGDLRNLQTAVLVYMTDFRQYPASLTWLIGLQVYDRTVNKIPIDPFSDPDTYYKYQCSDTTSRALYVISSRGPDKAGTVNIGQDTIASKGDDIYVTNVRGE